MGGVRATRRNHMGSSLVLHYNRRAVACQCVDKDDASGVAWNWAAAVEEAEREYESERGRDVDEYEARAEEAERGEGG